MLAAMPRATRRTPARTAAISRRLPASHQPVMLTELLEWLAPSPGQVVVDATLGAGGVSAAFLTRILPGGRVLALDRDPSAVSAARQRFAVYGDAFTAVVGRFSNLERIAAEHQLQADIVVMDLGISSIQLDDPARGFSFQVEGPLDMRMAPSEQQTQTAADIVASYSEADLADLFFELGEERHSRAMARAITARRRQTPIRTTTDLAQICAQALPRRLWPKRIHPATRVFLALRVAVNDELQELERGLVAATQILRPDGRIGTLSFQPSEHRLTKHSLNVLATDCVCPSQQLVCTCAHRATLSLLTRRSIKPSPEEVERNPRARSAQLRVAVRLPAASP
ncbi:MAG TPA: 16S rRNA (cytosine(1402)-N(4))-methyltransferase RsmH [Candidatus Saccharimonadales bacterium]|nr:16S rRNA (cytosine(1402)-N(4))-methyltransferase RsmH [Candidatus Saccharimonadales bacterium]